MTQLVIRNIGECFTGDIDQPMQQVSSITMADGRIVSFDDAGPADAIIDAGGGAVLPGLVDGHVHPTFGEWTPAQDAIGWITNYLNGGTTTMVSAGELHVPGLPFDALTPELVTSLAVVSASTTGKLRPGGMKMHAGTVLLVPGMNESHFDRLAAVKSRLAKFIFYPFDDAPAGEAQRYVQLCHERNIKVKIHTGGVSRSGASRPVGFAEVESLQPDIAAHVSGGPIPMSDHDLDRVVDDVVCAVEICSSMNYRSTVRVVQRLSEQSQLSRLVMGTDTPGGTGVIPRGMLRNILLLSGICGLDPGAAIAVATGNTASAHGLEEGRIAVGSPADVVVCGPVTGSQGSTVSDAIAHGDLPGISHVIIDGLISVAGRSTQTPPPHTPARTVC